MNRQILLIEEDDEAKAFTTAMKAAGVKCSVEVINDAEEAVEYCCGSGAFADRRQFPLPDLVLLDVKLGQRTGLEVLKRIRAESALKHAIVIMLSGTRHLQDVASAYSYGANAFIVKPSDTQELKNMIQAVSTFWLTQNVPPPVI